jgi:hypothetical protein
MSCPRRAIFKVGGGENAIQTGLIAGISFLKKGTKQFKQA